MRRLRDVENERMSKVLRAMFTIKCGKYSDSKTIEKKVVKNGQSKDRNK